MPRGFHQLFNLEGSVKRVIILSLSLGLLIAACNYKASHPILTVKDYERLLVGNLEADYIGDANCLSSCHVHDKTQRDFRLSIHGEQISSETGLPLVNCESCHGPGSMAIARAKEEEKCDTGTLLPIKTFPPPAQSLLCLSCHSAASSPNLVHWNASPHAMGQVSCFDCHQLHKGPEQKVSRRQESEMCFGCHPQVKAQFNHFSRHPLREGRMTCSDCHEPHGTTQEKLLRDISVKQMCTRCHMEFHGPFVYEHADVTEDCTNCHRPHGSPNTPLLTVSQPFLCLQCHAGHLGSNYPTLINDHFKGAYYTRCTDCHSTIHGTDIPSAKGRGTFIAR
jgi:DmsE family decaheme c-type cytochrome